MSQKGGRGVVDKYFKYIQIFVLVALCLQTTGYCVSVSISKKILHETYSNYEVLGLSEILKLLVSYVFLRFDSSSKTSTSSIFSLLTRGRKLIILVVLYAVANIIPFYAINNIGAPMFTVVMQLKIFATAGFSTCMLGRSYSATKWRALVLLVVGCILVSSPILNHSPSPPPTLQTNATNIAVIPSTPSTSQSNSSFLSIFDLLSEIISSYGPGLLGLCATLLQATISGFTAVYFEALLKDKDDETTIWERNFQLAFYSIVVMIITVVTEQIISDPTLSTSSEPLPVMFSNWTILAFIIAILQAFGGLLVAGTLRYADSVLKCFATAVSIGLTSIVGYFFLGNQVDFIVTLGYVVTIISIFNYTLDATPIGVFGNSNSCNGSDPTNYHPVKDIDEENCYDMNGVENYPKDLRRKVEN